MPFRDSGSDAELAMAAALAGAEVVREMFGAPLERHDKGRGDFATDADLASEAAVLEVLRYARPDDAVLGEETGRIGESESERMWLVDPLCGTANYAAGHLMVAVNVALREGTDIVAAASADPSTGEVYWTDGANPLVRRGHVIRALRPSARTGLVDVNLESPYPTIGLDHGSALLADSVFTERFRPRVVSTTLAVAFVAAGKRAGYITDGEMRDNVHFSAGVALCLAAGCTVTDLRGEQLSSEAAGLIAAADEETHAALLDVIARQAEAGV
ncbi:inositol monophosphatase family protein [Glycomyces salinus]|uniref:inositol monophosphatase family protein n=1 Tax=Glycomyces salinus TaxID=980294 RepID=UPI0018ECA887|nr:inositol monophosphatase family protein [Glycomyces salinus]